MSTSSTRIFHNSTESLHTHVHEFHQNLQDSKIIAKDPPILILVLTTRSLHLILHSNFLLNILILSFLVDESTIMLSQSSEGGSSVLRVRLRVVKNP